MLPHLISYLAQHGMDVTNRFSLLAIQTRARLLGNSQTSVLPAPMESPPADRDFIARLLFAPSISYSIRSPLPHLPL